MGSVSWLTGNDFMVTKILDDNERPKGKELDYSDTPKGADVSAMVHMSTEKSVNRSLKIRSLLTWFGPCRIPSAGAVTT